MNLDLVLARWTDRTFAHPTKVGIVDVGAQPLYQAQRHAILHGRRLAVRRSPGI